MFILTCKKVTPGGFTIVGARGREGRGGKTDLVGTSPTHLLSISFFFLSYVLGLVKCLNLLQKNMTYFVQYKKEKGNVRRIQWEQTPNPLTLFIFL